MDIFSQKLFGMSQSYFIHQCKFLSFDAIHFGFPQEVSNLNPVNQHIKTMAKNVKFLSQIKVDCMNFLNVSVARLGEESIKNMFQGTLGIDFSIFPRISPIFMDTMSNSLLFHDRE